MGEGSVIIFENYKENPIGFLCVYCYNTYFYYGNCMFDLIVCGIYFVPAT